MFICSPREEILHHYSSRVTSAARLKKNKVAKEMGIWEINEIFLFFSKGVVGKADLTNISCGLGSIRL